MSGQRERSGSCWTGGEPKGTLARGLRIVHVRYVENPMKAKAMFLIELVVTLLAVAAVAGMFTEGVDALRILK